jgi:uncharacterized protein
MTADEVIRLLGLEPLELEGAFFAETYRSRAVLATGALPGLGAARALATAIYYLLDPGTYSALHRLRSDEIYHFYLGDPVELLLLGPGAAGRTLRLGGDLAAGGRPQALVPAGAWQGSRLVPGGRWALLGTTMSPGFDTADFELGHREDLAAQWPQHRALIEALTRTGR